MRNERSGAFGVQFIKRVFKVMEGVKGLVPCHLINYQIKLLLLYIYFYITCLFFYISGIVTTYNLILK